MRAVDPTRPRSRPAHARRQPLRDREHRGCAREQRAGERSRRDHPRRCTAQPAHARQSQSAEAAAPCRGVHGCHRTDTAVADPLRISRAAPAAPRRLLPSRWHPGCARSRCRERSPTRGSPRRASGAVREWRRWCQPTPGAPGATRSAARTVRISLVVPRMPRCRRRPGWPAPGGYLASDRGEQRPPVTGSPPRSPRHARRTGTGTRRSPRRSAANAQPDPRHAAPPASLPRAPWPLRPAVASHRPGTAAKRARTRGRC